MKKLLVLTGLVAVLSFAVVSSSSGAPASSFTANSFFPIDLTVFVPCANGGLGEDVQLSGTRSTTCSTSPSTTTPCTVRPTRSLGRGSQGRGWLRATSTREPE